VADGALLFTGSSTIRLWDSLALDFAPWPVENRGFGGAVVSQMVHFAAELVPRSPKLAAIVFYCGGNDVAWGVRNADIVSGVERFASIAEARAPGTPFYLLSVAKTPLRFLSWSRVDRLNERLRELAEAKGLRWVDVTTPLLGPRGRPRRSLFLIDGIHPNARGYAIWTQHLRERFEAELRQ
jgi:lysophospholipase L1-like esterase